MKMNPKDLVLVCVVVIIAPLLTYGFLSRQTNTDCKIKRQTIRLVMENQIFTPNNVTAKRCDVLEITNNQPTNTIPALGAHDDHANYPGYKEVLLKPGDTLLLTLTQSGDYLLHDHLHEPTEAKIHIQ